MTHADCKSVEPGVLLKIGNSFVEPEHPDLVEYLGTVQVVEKIDFSGTGWIYFKELPQPFAMSEVAGFYTDNTIDDATVPYLVGDMCLIFGEVSS